MDDKVNTSRLNAVQDAISIFVDVVKNSIDQNGYAWVGIGTGSTISLFIDKLKGFLSSAQLKKCFAISTSFQSQQLILNSGMQMGLLSQISELDIAIDGADEVDSTGTFAIKGGGGAHMLEKIVSLSAKLFIIIVDSDKVGLPQVLGNKVL